MKIQVPVVRREVVGVRLSPVFETSVEAKTVFDYDFQAARRLKGAGLLVYRLLGSVTFAPVIAGTLVVYGCARVIGDRLVEAYEDLAEDLPEVIGVIHKAIVGGWKAALNDVVAR